VQCLDCRPRERTKKKKKKKTVKENIEHEATHKYCDLLQDRPVLPSGRSPRDKKKKTTVLTIATI
jgi:hypothetical protein